MAHVKAWQDFTKVLASELAAGESKTSSTALLVAMHNLVTESVSHEWAQGSKKQYLCPDRVHRELTSAHSIFGDDEVVKSAAPPHQASVPGVPGLDKNDELVTCVETSSPMR